MSSSTDSILHKYFKINYSTELFVLLSILSLGIYTYFWFIKLLELFDKEDVKSSIFLIFAVMVFPDWLVLIDEFINMSVREYNRLLIWCLIAIPYLSYHYRNDFKFFLEKNGVSINLSNVYLTIFPIFYQYYLMRNNYIQTVAQQKESITSSINLNKKSDNTDMNKINKEEIKNKIIKLNTLYKEGRITQEQYNFYINKLRGLLK